MSCFLENEKGELAVPLSIEKFMSVELKDGKLVINNVIQIPTEDILAIRFIDRSE